MGKDFLGRNGLERLWAKIKNALAGKADSTHSHDDYASRVILNGVSHQAQNNAVTLPSYPSALKNPKPLNISVCDGLSCGLPQSYDGSAEMNLMLATGNHTHIPGDVGIKWAGNISSSGVPKKSCGKYEITVTKLGNGRLQINASGFDLASSLVLATPLATGFCTATFGGGTVYLRDSASTYFNVGVNLLIM